MAKRWMQIASGDLRFMVDVDFFLSGYGCAYGSGCPGTEGDSAMGCCGHGAEVEEDEVESLSHYVSLLSPGTWEHHGESWVERVRYSWKDWLPWTQPKFNTALTERGCIFSNSKDFDGGMGCALHIAATARGESHVGTKPSPCWMVPIRFEWDEAHEMYWLRAHGDSDWGYKNDWWCTEPASEDVEQIAWQNKSPVYQRFAEELAAMFDEQELASAYIEDIEPVLHGLWENSGRKVRTGTVPVTISNIGGSTNFPL